MSPPRFIRSIAGPSDFQGDIARMNRAAMPFGPNGPILEDIDRMATFAAEGDEFDEMASAKAAEAAGEEAKAPYSRITPPSAKHSVLGNTQLISSGQNLLELANWHGSDLETMPVTITLGSALPPGVLSYGSLQDFTPYAVVRWGTRGIFCTAEIDVGRGVQFSVAASSVIVQAGLEVANPDLAPGSLLLSAMLGFYATQKTVPMTRTRTIRILSNITPVEVVIPPFAKTIEAVTRSTPTEPLQLEFLRNGNGIVMLPAGVNMAPITIPNAAHTVRVRNTGAVNQAEVNVVFGLSL